MPYKFVAIKFLDEDGGFNTVSERWISNVDANFTCRFPKIEDFPKKVSLKSLAISHADCDTWKEFPCKIYEKFDTYKDAEMKVVQLINDAITTCDEESEGAVGKGMKLRTHRKPKTPFDDDSDDDGITSTNVKPKNSALPPVPVPPPPKGSALNKISNRRTSGSGSKRDSNDLQSPSDSRRDYRDCRNESDSRRSSRDRRSRSRRSRTGSRDRRSRSRRSKTGSRDRRSRSRRSTRDFGGRRSRSRRSKTGSRDRRSRSRRSETVSGDRRSTSRWSTNSKDRRRASRSRSNSSHRNNPGTPLSMISDEASWRSTALKSHNPPMEESRLAFKRGTQSSTSRSSPEPNEDYLYDDSLASSKVLLMKLGKKFLTGVIPPDRNLDEIKKMVPAASGDALTELNTELLKNADLYKQLVTYLSLGGGDDVGNATRTAFRKILTDNVQQLFNWEGQKGKKKFHTLSQIKKAIFESVRAHFPKASDAEIKSHITCDLRNAQQRCDAKKNKGKTGRTEKTNAESTEKTDADKTDACRGDEDTPEVDRVED